MKFKIMLFLILSILPNFSFGAESFQNRADTLNSNSIELFDLSVLELAKLIELPKRGYFVSLYALDDLELLEGLEKKGYIKIDEMNEKTKKMLGNIPFDHSDRHI